MEKQVQFLGRTDSGIFCQSLFGSAGAFEKTAGADPFADWETGDQLRSYIRTITRQDRLKYCYVLVNALGAGEYFGSNINADYFPWNALAHEGDDYGYKTFLRAHAFQHHRNKEPERAFGIPVVSALNTRMKRVELIIRLDREKAKFEQADGIISRIDAGEFPDVSMGCKVPYDICSICGNRSKTRNDYCEHMMPPAELRQTYGPNKILPDGRKIFVYNTLPRFFDISFVFIGADKTAKVMAKLASKNNQLCLGDVCTLSAESPLLKTSAEVSEKELALGEAVEKKEHQKSVEKLYKGIAKDHLKEHPHYYSEELKKEQKEKNASASCACGCGSCDGMDKLASAFGQKLASKKLAEIIKDIPAGSFAMKRLPSLERSEPDIDLPDIDTLAESAPLARILGLSTSMGMVLKPHEFQRLVLKRMGEDDFADRLSLGGMVFRPSESFGEIGISCNGEIDHCLDNAVSLLTKYVKERSAFGEPFTLRLTFSSRGGKKALPKPKPIAHPLLDKISAAYNGYRREVMVKLSQATEAVQSDPKLRVAVLGDGLVNMFSKHASVSKVASLDTVAYMMGAHLPNRNLLSTTAVAEAIAVSNEQFLSEETAAQGF